MKDVRWIIIVTAEDGGVEAFGPWRDYDKAAKHASQLRQRSGVYAARNPVGDYRVTLTSLDRWPGIREYVKSF